MATIVNNPGNSDSGAAGWVVAAIVIVGVILVALFVWPGMDAFGGNNGGTNINVQVPALDSSGSGPGAAGA